MTDYKLFLADNLSLHTGIPSSELAGMIEIPPQQDMGDFSFPCFKLAKQLRKAPAQIAKDLSEKLVELEHFVKIDSLNGFLNFYLDKEDYIKGVVSETLELQENFVKTTEGKGKTVLVEFSSPNIAKPFHVGHAFTTILGNALYHIYDNLGYDTIRLNHLGDYGTQFGKLISAYKHWGDEAALEDHPINELLRIYVKFHEEAKCDVTLEDEARRYFKNLEDGCSEEKMLWQRFRDLSLKEFNLIYDRLGVRFDDLNGESFYSDKIDEVVDLLNERNLLIESDGAKVVMLDEFGLPPCIILKSDGTTIYASRDVAAILYRIKTYGFYKNIYVVGNPQALHFKQVFAVASKLGLKTENSCIHVGFGLVKFANMKFSTREGNIILLEDLLNECVSKTYEIIAGNQLDRKTDMSDIEMRAIAEKIGLGAVIYTFCKNSRDRDIVFSWEEMLDFDGDSAPYVMYTYARCNSILKKADIGELNSAAYVPTIGDSENFDQFALAKSIYGLKESIQKAAESNEPFMLVRQVTLIARTFNKFYNNTPILSNENPAIRASSLALCQATCISIKKGLNLLGIDAVERM